MSWFDTTKLASIANKAMKEAQKTLDSALDIAEEQAAEEERSSSALWSAWKTTKSESQPQLTAGENSVEILRSDSSPSLNSEPVSMQPKRVIIEKEVVVEEVTGGSSSVLGGMDELNVEVESENFNGFATSRLVVQDSMLARSDDLRSPSVELVSPSVETMSPPSELAFGLQSPGSSVGLVSLESSVCLASPSPSLEVVTPPQEEDPTAPSMDGRMQEELASSVSSSKTVVSEQREGLDDRLAEAMVEESRQPVSASCSSRSSEVVRVESLGGSEVASGDEGEGLATGTSSDIEVLSYRGHARVGSDTSVGEEMEMLRRRNRELEELVSAREARLVAVANEMAELQGEVEEGKADRIVTAELRRRVALLEEEVANGVRRSEGQAKELEKMRKAVAAEAGEDQEREEMIADLRSEGEALARQNGKQAEVIRKLRSKEKTADKDIDKFKSESEKAKSELERLSKSLAEKNSLEGTQSEAIKNLTEANQAWEVENKKIKNDLEDNVEKVSGLRKSLEAAYREMAEMKRKLEEEKGEAAAAALSREVSLRKEAVSKLEEEGRAWTEARLALENQVRSSQASAKLAEESAASRDEMHKQEVASLRQRLEQSDTRHEDLAESVGLATKPLLRQIEMLQSNLRESAKVQEQVEAGLTCRLQQTGSHLAAAQERERAAAQQYQAASARLAAVEARQTQEASKVLALEEEVERLREEKRVAEEGRKIREKEEGAAKTTLVQQVADLEREKQLLEANLEAEQAESEGRRRKGLALVEQLRERDRKLRELQAEAEARTSPSHTSSPTPSLSRLSTAGSDYSREPWPEEMFGTAVASTSTLYEAQGRLGNTASLMETLQSQLKLREGEVAGLQAEVANMHRVRESMSQEMTRLTIRTELADETSHELSGLREEFHKLQKQYQTMLTMYGEKTEEAEELRLDLEDVKEMYKMQIVQLTGQPHPEM